MYSEQLRSGKQMIVGLGRRETDGGAVILNTSRALLRTGRAIGQVRFKETTTPEKFYVLIKFDLGMWSLLSKTATYSDPLGPPPQKKS